MLSDAKLRHRALGTKWSAPRLMQPRKVEDCSFLRAQTPKFPGALGRCRALPGFPAWASGGRFFGTPHEDRGLRPAPRGPRQAARDPRGPQEDLKGAPRGFKAAPRGPKEAQRGSKMAQGASKTVPRRPKRPPRRSQDGPRGPQDGPRATQDDPRGPQDEPQRGPSATPNTEKSCLPP